jgi:hypothetical protein
MGDSVKKPKTFTKPFVPQKDKDQKNPQKEWKGKEKLDEETRRELMRNKMFFNCRYLWVPRHRCMSKGQIHYIEVASDSEEEEIRPSPDSDSSSSEEEKAHEEGKYPRKPQP